MGSGRTITVSAPAKVHLLGEHAAVYGQPAIMTAVGLRLTVTVSQGRTIPAEFKKIQKIIEKIVRKELKLNKIPQYSLTISSEIPVGCGLGYSAAVSAAYIGALLAYLRVDWNLELINKLSYEAEKVFHSNPSGGDNTTVVYGGLIWYRKETPELKLIQPVPFSIPSKIAKNFILINTGQPQQTTKDMVISVKNLYAKKPKLVNKFLEDQEKLVKELLTSLKEGQEKDIIRIIKQGEKNLESIDVSSRSVQNIIRQIEKMGGAAKICGGGSVDGPTGVLLCYHSHSSIIKNVAKSHGLDYYDVHLGVEGIRRENE